MPEDRSRYVNDEEAMILASSLSHAKSLLTYKLIPIAKRHLVSMHTIDNLHNKIRTYIDDACERLMVNRSPVEEAECIEELMSYLIMHRLYMEHHRPELWRERNED